MTAITSSKFSPIRWHTIGLATLAVWLSGSLLLDFVLMPTMYSAGMMTQLGFASAGYSLFWIFNHLELLGAALVLTSVLVVRQTTELPRWFLPAAGLLFAIALVYTYGLTPQMSALGLQLNWFETTEVPTAMNQLHGGYWLLELLKLGLGAALLSSSYRLIRT
jgi:hypothetical protein